MAKYWVVFHVTDAGEVFLGLCGSRDEASSLIAKSGRCGLFKIYLQVGSRRVPVDTVLKPCRGV